MMNAYNELYLNDAQMFLAHAFDYAINNLKLNPDWFGSAFSRSKLCEEFENGNPSIISGQSGKEAIDELINSLIDQKKLPVFSLKEGKSKEYWAGWVLAYYQWYTVKRFKDLFKIIPLSEIIDMYYLYHEMDIMNFIDDLNEKYNSIISDTNLKQIREARGISQAKLSELSGVSLRMIQLYEQRANDIDKAQAGSLYRLSKVLGCKIEDLLENPIKCGE